MEENPVLRVFLFSHQVLLGKVFFMKKRNHLSKMVLSALFLALSYVLPFFTGQIPEIGAMLCPLHIPVLLCGFLCGWQWGLLIGVTAPLLRAVTLGMPPLFPTAVCMTFELGAYGAVSGGLYEVLPKKRSSLYSSLLVAMLVGRLVWGVAMYVALVGSGGSFTLTAFVAGALTNAIPGIILQILLIPFVVMFFCDKKETESNRQDRR